MGSGNIYTAYELHIHIYCIRILKADMNKRLSQSMNGLDT